MSEWYVFAAALAIVGAALFTRVDLMPASRGKVAAIYARWGFLMSVLMYAFLIDSLRVPYSEPAIWMFLGVGCLGALVLGVWVKRHG